MEILWRITYHNNTLFAITQPNHQSIARNIGSNERIIAEPTPQIFVMITDGVGPRGELRYRCAQGAIVRSYRHEKGGK